jgi:signal transduction histidine kinase
VRYRPSLYVRLILLLLGPLLLGMAAAWAIGVGIVTRSLEQRVEGQLRNATTVLATWGLPYTPDLLRRLASVQQSDFVLLDRSGRVAATTSATVGEAIEHSLSGDPNRPWAGASIRRLESPVRSIAFYQPLDASQDPRYSALIAVAPLGDAEAATERAAWWLGLVMLAAAAILGGVLLAAVRNITGPLTQLSAFADRISAGERERRLELQRADEIGALGEALNAMMERLRGYEARLASRSRMLALGEMSARLAHEIRNPLTGLKLHLQLLAERVDPAESGRVGQLLTEVERLELLVASTLMLGAEQPLELAPASIAQLAADVLELMGPSLAHRGIQADSRCDERLEARIDRDRMRQALLNLIVNAADAMPQGGRLRIRAERDAAMSKALIAVEDSGPGVDQDLRARLSNGALSTKPFGLGVGLAICRDIAAAHGGELRIERSGELGGARVVIALSLDHRPAVATT